MAPGGPMAVGVDVGADRLHLVCLGPSFEISVTAVLDPADRAGIDKWFARLPPQSVVAIDAPRHRVRHRSPTTRRCHRSSAAPEVAR